VVALRPADLYEKLSWARPGGIPPGIFIVRQLIPVRIEANSHPRLVNPPHFHAQEIPGGRGTAISGNPSRSGTPWHEDLILTIAREDGTRHARPRFTNLELGSKRSEILLFHLKSRRSPPIHNRNPSVTAANQVRSRSRKRNSMLAPNASGGIPNEPYQEQRADGQGEDADQNQDSSEWFHFLNTTLSLINYACSPLASLMAF
jgi:hypothetical protein